MSEFDLGRIIAEIIVAENERDLTIEEEKILYDWLNQSEGNRALYRQLKEGNNVSEQIRELELIDTDKAFNKFLSRTRKDRVIVIQKDVLKVVAMLVLALLTWVVLNNINTGEPQTPFHYETAIEPGSSKAILQLADGTIINLENENTSISEQGATISAVDNKVVYSVPEDKNEIKSKEIREIRYNTISIPRGGEYRLTLSDGTRVWLNSETTMKYPVTFTGKFREIFINGEAYFEVTHNKKVPFIVNTGKMKIRVLGTSFNVRAYPDEKEERTTLIDGEVLVKSNQSDIEFRMNPNHQFITSKTGGELRTVDVSSIVAWKEGRILFENNSLGEILGDLSRWYDLSVIYENDELTQLRFSIDMKRYDNFDKFLEIVSLTQKVKFEIDGNKVNVKKGK